MEISKVIAAKVCACETGWADADECAECAEQNTISIQRHYLRPEQRFGFFTIGKDERSLPMEQLTDPNYAHFLSLSVPCDAVNPEIISLVDEVHSKRQERRSEMNKTIHPKLLEDEITEACVIIELSQDPLVREPRYFCAPYPWFVYPPGKTQELLKTRGLLVKGDDEVYTTPATWKEMGKILNEKTEGRAGYTLSELDKYARRAKTWKMQPDIKEQ